MLRGDGRYGVGDLIVPTPAGAPPYSRALQLPSVSPVALLQAPQDKFFTYQELVHSTVLLHTQQIDGVHGQISSTLFRPAEPHAAHGLVSPPFFDSSHR